MKFKIAGLASTALLLLSPISGALTTIAEPSVVQAENNWDYDTANPGLGDYDKLLQNAGPSDGIVDWYPTKEALSNNPTGQDLVKQLIELSIATNNANSNARNVLFNDTNGANDRESYQDTYNKYSLAFGFIAQLLDFNNEKTGLGAQLAQGAVSSGDYDPRDPRSDQSVINQAVSQKPRKGQGHTIADVLGKAFFGNADDAYAQIYINGYDNVAQNEANIIREATSSITIVAVSKLTGRKATAIFKLNNKTLPTAPADTKLNNYKDDSVYALDDKNGNPDIAGLNMTTAPQSTIDNIKFSKESTFWVDNTNGGGTIVVPRGTTAQQIAELIAKKQLASNNTLQESAPMKAIQNVTGSHSYSHFYENERWASSNRRDAANLGGVQEYNFAREITFGINGPYANQKASSVTQSQTQQREYNNVFNSSSGFAPSSSGGPIRITNGQAENGWFGGNSDGSNMWDTNSLSWDNNTAKGIPDVLHSEGTPDDGNLELPDYLKTNSELNGKTRPAQPAMSDSNSNSNSNVGKVKHLFNPNGVNYFKEAYDANHFATNSPTLQDRDVQNIAREIANNGSFSNTATDGQIKKSFTYEAPTSAWLYKSYNNPYSTVMSSAGAQTVDGKKLDPASSWENSTIKPQEKVDLNDLNNPDPKEGVALTPGHARFVKVGTTAAPLTTTTTANYFYIGTFANQNPDNSSNQIIVAPAAGESFEADLKPGTKGTLAKFGAVGFDGENPTGNAEFGTDSKAGPTGSLSVLPGSALYHINLTEDAASRLSSADLDATNITEATANSVTSDDLKMAELAKMVKVLDDDQYFVQVWDKNTHIKDENGKFVSDPQPLIYNKNILDPSITSSASYDAETLGQVDSPNFEAKYYTTGLFVVNSAGTVQKVVLGDHLNQTAASKRAYFNSNLYNNPDGALTKEGTKNNSRFFVSQDFAMGPVSSDLISDAGPEGSGITIDGEYYPYGKSDSTNGKTPEENAAQILKLAVMYNNPHRDDNANGADVKPEFTEDTGYKLVSIDDAASKQGVSEDTLAKEVAKVTGKSAREVKNTKWVEATLPRLKRNAGKARINVVVYDQDKTAISTPAKAETKPSFSTTDLSRGNDPFNVNLRPYTTTYDDGAVLKGADVPQNFQNLLSNSLVAGNADLTNNPTRLEQVLVSAFLNSWQQNDGSFDQTDTGVGVNSPLYLYGGFGISNSDTKNSYSQWPNGYTTNTSDYLTATSHYSGDFYRGGKDLQLVRGGTVKGIPASALKADVSKVDLSKAGTYPVVYTYTNPSNAKDSASITVPVTVKDSAAPVFAFQGGSDLTIRVGESFDRNAYKVVGNWQIFNKYEGDYNKLVNGEGIATGSDGKPQVTITGDVDTHTPGVYQVTYEATNLSGIKAKMVRNINVLPQETGNNPDKSDWTVSVMKGVGYINYTPGYGINVWNAPAGAFTGQRLLHGTSWKIFQKAVNSQGKVYYNVGKNQWLDGAYVSFTPVSALQPLNGIVTINYVPGYGVNLWKAPEATGGYYEGRKLKHGTQWKVFGIQDGFYKVGGNQWIQAKYAKFQAR